ncbi:Uncharacterised protein [Mycobacteroides abscessus subsp. abscessus]|nr:Uncharacterised protein [Mycobacteroides abscessus subsp. abscessus]
MENVSLLPFPAHFSVLRLRERFSVTFSGSFFCSRAQRTFLCYLFRLIFLFSGSENVSLLPLPAHFPALGLRERFSVTFSGSRSCSRAQRTFLCYLFRLTFLLSGSENVSLLPLLAHFSILGLREHFSVTFSGSFFYSRAQRTFLCYLFRLIFLFSGSENVSLLPFPAHFPVLGLRERFSVTFSGSRSCSRAQRTFLCYLFLLIFLLSGLENVSLLPFPAHVPALGLRERFSVTFSCSRSCSRAQRTFLCYLFLLSFLLLGSENVSLLPFPALVPALGLRERFSVTFSSSKKAANKVVFQHLLAAKKRNSLIIFYSFLPLTTC